MHIIAISGKMRCGKSTTAQYLTTFLNQLSIPTIRLGFGDPIKKEVNDLYGIPYEGMYVQEFKIEQYSLKNVTDRGVELLSTYSESFSGMSKEKIQEQFITPRCMLQTHGTGIRRRNFGDDYWERCVYQQIIRGIEKLGDEGVYIIDDVRHPTEIEMLRDKWPEDHSLFRLHPYPGWNFDSPHVSEHLLDNWPDSEYTKAFYPAENKLLPVAEEILKISILS